MRSFLEATKKQMQDKVKSKIDPKHHDKYDFKKITSQQAVYNQLSRAKMYGHLKEEVEQVDEISQKLAINYVKKADLDVKSKQDKLAKSFFKDAGVNSINKRKANMRTAANKLSGNAKVNATESAEQVDETSDELRARYRKAAQKNIDKIDFSKDTKDNGRPASNKYHNRSAKMQMSKNQPSVYKSREREARANLASYGESVEQVDEVLSYAARRKKGRDMKKNKAKIAMGRRRASNRMADLPRLKKRAQKQARNQFFKKFAKGADRSSISPARRAEIEKRLDRIQPRIIRVARKLVPKVRKDERNRHSMKKSDK